MFHNERAELFTHKAKLWLSLWQPGGPALTSPWGDNMPYTNLTPSHRVPWKLLSSSTLYCLHNAANVPASCTGNVGSEWGLSRTEWLEEKEKVSSQVHTLWKSEMQNVEWNCNLSTSGSNVRKERIFTQCVISCFSVCIYLAMCRSVFYPWTHTLWQFTQSLEYLNHFTLKSLYQVLLFGTNYLQSLLISLVSINAHRAV